MKYKLILPVFVTCIFFACNQAGKENTISKTGIKKVADSTVAKPDFSNIVFASKKDTSCGMPLSAGLLDTAIVNGKTYGFCSKECKDAFLKTLQAKAAHRTER